MPIYNAQNYLYYSLSSIENQNMNDNPSKINIGERLYNYGVILNYLFNVKTLYEIKDKKLHVIKVKNNAVFKKQSARLMLKKPDSTPGRAIFVPFPGKRNRRFTAANRCRLIIAGYDCKVRNKKQAARRPAKENDDGTLCIIRGFILRSSSMAVGHLRGFCPLPVDIYN